MATALGLGAYPIAQLSDATLAIVPGATALCMGESNNERHAFATSLKALGAVVWRRHWQPDPQVDMTQTPASQAALWYGYILGGLTPAQFLAIYAGAVGPNELYANSDTAAFPWLNSFEVALCNLLHAVGIHYAWGSIPVGNVDPIPFATTFASINAIADAVCYHVYIEPNATVLEPSVIWEYARRPYSWWQQCMASGVRFPPLLGGECGTYEAWTSLGMSGNAYVTLCETIAQMFDSWKTAGMPVLAPCIFGLGVEGTLGTAWNIGTAECSQIGTYNRGAGNVALPFDPTKIGQFATWQNAAIAALEKTGTGSDPRDPLAFVEYLKATKQDYAHPHDFGFPDIVYTPVP